MNRRSRGVVSVVSAVSTALSTIVLCAVGLLGCPGPDPRPDGGADAGDGVVELGTGQLDWEPLSAADPTVELIYGAQGGFHVWGRGRFRTFAPDVDVSFRAVRESDGLELHHPSPVRRYIEGDLRYGLLPTSDGRYQTDAELVILTLDCARDLVGRRLTLELTVRERSTGRSSTTSRSVRVIDEIPSPTGCLSERDGTHPDGGSASRDR